MMEDFTRSLSRGVLIAAAILIPIGLILSGIFGGGKGLAGAAVGFGIAVLHSVLAIWILKYALKKPPSLMPAILMASYFVRLVLIVGVLIGFYYVKSVDIVALVACFGSLYLVQIALEVFLAWRSFGITTGKQP